MCTRCGATRDFYSDELDAMPIPDSVTAFGTVDKAQVEVRGTCLRCSKEFRQRSRPHLKEEQK